MQWKNELTEILKIEYPIIQAPMLGVSTPQMVAAVSGEGGLGSLPVGGLSADKTADLIRKTKALTSRPFAVNIFANDLPAKNEAAFDTMKHFLADFAGKNQIHYTDSLLENIAFHSYLDLIDVLLEEGVSIVSFTFGVPDDKSITSLKNKGVVLIGTATCVQEAEVLNQKGIDIIVAQGFEAGGHRGTFINSKNPPLIGSMALIPQVADAVDKPIVAAGAIADGRGIKAAFVLGAKGVQVGSAFIASTESAAAPVYKANLERSVDTDTVLTKSFTGRWARGVQNELIKTIEDSEIEIPPYPFQIALTSSFREHGQKQNNREFLAMWAGQFATKARQKNSSEIFRELVKECEDLHV